MVGLAATGGKPSLFGSGGSLGKLGYFYLKEMTNKLKEAREAGVPITPAAIQEHLVDVAKTKSVIPYVAGAAVQGGRKIPSRRPSDNRGSGGCQWAFVALTRNGRQETL